MVETHCPLIGFLLLLLVALPIAGATSEEQQREKSKSCLALY